MADHARTDDAVIKAMVDRFLAWKLPPDFSPDDGISFEPTFNDHMPGGPVRRNPCGTNLLDARQAEAMVRHMLAGSVDDGPLSQYDVERLETVARICDAKALHVEASILRDVVSGQRREGNAWQAEADGFLYALLGSEPDVASNMLRANPEVRASLHRALYERRPREEAYDAMMARLLPDGLPS